MFRAMDCGNRWIREKAAASLNPSQVETSLVQLNERWPPTVPPFADVVRRFPLGEAALIHLLAVSSICATRLIRNPGTLLWLQQREVCLAARGYAEMLNELHNLADDSVWNQNFAALRSWKGREMTRVALRELANVAPLEETTAELSQIAEICIKRVFEHWNVEFRRRYGSPTAEFAILALGKLGGHELNHSSDVDLIFLYSEEGQLSPHFSYHEFFNRLRDKLERNVKLGRGGIREIEFVVQTLQFIHGARHAFLQESSTLKALQALAQLELVPQDQILHLNRAYRFLRRVEHRLQIEAEEQTHTVPST